MKTTRKLINLEGMAFGQLTVLRRDTAIIGNNNGQIGQKMWMCKCSCEKTCKVRSGELRYGKTKSCGCLRKNMNLKHGHTTHKNKSKIYGVWNAMIQRCTNPKADSYPRYGGRGITVCKEWLVFKNFLADMGKAPKGLSIERMDNNGPYSKANCCWATMEVQNKNKRLPGKVSSRKIDLPLGVNKHKSKFTASFTFKKEKYYLGLFRTPEEAAAAREKAEQRLGVQRT